jgi:TPR repeat protein
MTNITTRAWLAVGLVGLTVATCASFDAFASAGSTDVQQLNDGLLAYARVDSLEALQILLPLAKKGEPLAQMIVGRLYARGEGSPHDCGEAVKWFTRAAEQGDADAQFELATFYHQGQCVAKDDPAAVIWFELSARMGDPRGLNAIGEIYLGRGDIPPDYAKAVGWFLRAAKLFDGDALYQLGVLHALGRGVPKDYLEAYKWFDLSAHLALGEDLDKAIRARDAIREYITPAQVEDAAQRTKKWLATLMQQLDDKKYGMK